MYTVTSFARVPFWDLDFKPKVACISKWEISSKMKAKMQFPCRISNVDLSLENNSSPKINRDTYTLSRTDMHTTTKRTIENGNISKLNFVVRSYEISADGRLSHGTILNYLQEAAVNWVQGVGLEGGSGVARTPEMIKQNLIWVVAKTRIKIDKYPTRNDMVQTSTWGVLKNGGIESNITFCDAKTGEILIRATSLLVMMNQNTRRLCKAPGEVNAELEPYCLDVSLFAQEDNTKVSKLNDYTADMIIKGCTPKWTDIDINQHVNNAKYVSWILESVPEWLAKNYQVMSVALDYRRECAPNETLQSLLALSPVSPSDGNELVDTGNVLHSHHLLRTEDGAEILRGRIEWKPRRYPPCA